MNETEALKISVLAMQIFTIQPDETRAALLRKAVALRDFAATRAALERQAQTSRLLSIPDLLNDIGAEDKRDWIDRQRAARHAERLEQQKGRRRDVEEHAAILAWIEAQPPEDLARMRAAVEGKFTYLATRRWQGRPVSECLVLASLIYAEFSGRKERVSA